MLSGVSPNFAAAEPEYLPRAPAGEGAPVAPDAAAEAEESPPELPAARESEAAGSPDDLSEEERRLVAQLQARDRQVRSHEQAHLAAAGGLARGVSFSYEQGPDGRQYATGGEVGIDTSPESSPEATISKARQIRSAALAPASPSGQDRAVAAAASQLEAAAQAELTAQRRVELDAEQRGRSAAQFGGAENAGSSGQSLNVIG